MSAPESTARSKKPLIAVIVVAALIVGVGGWYFFLRDDAPDAFDIDTASGSVSETTDGTGAGTEPDAADDGVEGTWVVDATGGENGTSAGFRVDEELASIGSTTAVGRTEQVEGSLTIEGTTVTAVEVTVDMDSLETDDSRRDGRMRSALVTDEFPTSTFVLTQPIELGTLPDEGETISVTATGDLTIKDVTRSVDVALDARLVDGILVVVGSAPVVFEDYGVDKPSSAIVVSLADEGTMEFQLFFTRT
ncbi:YceI family protein [Actinospongicola halichondriae]|uniref:YceI family protein n=1 Tax=Actinospongicola halichondriae TaxID=3236844 RepID=UPI003D40089D